MNKKVKDIIERQGGKIFRVVFRKKDGTLRKMVCRRGVKKHLKGGENKVEAPDRPYMTVFDLQAGGYRTVNTDTVLSIKAGGREYKFEEEVAE